MKLQLALGPIVGLETTKTEQTSETKPSKVFMGIGYNPELKRSGERLDMLDFFNWFRTFQKADIEVTVWDASSYSIVNLRSAQGENEFEKLGQSPRAEDIISWMITEQDRNLSRDDLITRRINGLNSYKKLDEFRENCSLRTRYLRALASVTKTPVKIVSAWDTFREDTTTFAKSLEEALDFSRRTIAENPTFYKDFISGNDPIKRLYVPLEIAEVLYFQKTSEIDAKFGPTTELPFDSAIIQCQSDLGNEYTTLRCPLLEGQNKPAYLRDLSLEGKTLSTGMKRKQIARVFRKQPTLLEIYNRLLAPTGIEQDVLYSTTGMAIKIRNAMEAIQ